MTQIGVIEIIAGTFLVLGSRVIRIICCLSLVSLMVGALYLAYHGNRPTEDFINHGFLLFVSFLRLNMFFSPVFTPSINTNRTATTTTSVPSPITAPTTTTAIKTSSDTTKSGKKKGKKEKKKDK